jgi:hypothetical protein
MIRCNPGHHKDVFRILTDDTVWPFIHDDANDDKEKFSGELMQMLHHPGFYILMPRQNTVVMFYPVNSITYNIHLGAINGGGRRHINRDAFESVLWMVKNTNAQKIVAMIPDTNGKTIDLAKRTKMRKEGVVTKSFQKNGAIIDMIVFGATKDQILEEEKCQQQQVQ